MLYLVCADGHAFIPPCIVHKGSKFTEGHTIYLPDNWIIHLTESGYMDRDGYFKVITMFAKFSGATETNPQFLYQDAHDSHWDPDALSFAAANHVYVFFLKAQNSEEDQPLDNGPNCLLKRMYSIVLAEWIEKYSINPLNYMWFNKIISDAWCRFLPISSQVIINSFRKTRLHPLAEPIVNEEGTCGSACVTSM